MRNTYFTNGVNTERDLYEDLIIEAIKIYGYDAYYIPRNVISTHDIFNEDIESIFDSSYMMEMYVETVDGFAGQGDIMSKFGVEIRDQANLVVARRVFDKATVAASDIKTPREGDLIYLPLTKSLFEITFVETEQPFYQLGNLTVFNMTVEKYEYRGEEIDTGIGDVDDIQDRHSTVTPIAIVYDSPQITFERDYDVVITIDGTSPLVTLTADVLSVDDLNLILRVGQYTTNDGSTYILTDETVAITQTSSGASATGTIINTLDDDQYDNDQAATNKEFEEFGDEYISFEEDNPFGNP